MKFPKTLFAKIEMADGQSYIAADGDVAVLAEMGEKLRIGVYVLKDEVEVETVLKSTPVRRRSR